MVQRLRVQQQAGCVDLQPGQRDIAVGMADFHFTLAQDVQERTTGLRLEDMPPAQRATVEQRRLHPEAFQQAGESIWRRGGGGHAHGRMDNMYGELRLMRPASLPRMSGSSNPGRFPKEIHHVPCP